MSQHHASHISLLEKRAKLMQQTSTTALPSISSRDEYNGRGDYGYKSDTFQPIQHNNVAVQRNMTVPRKFGNPGPLGFGAFALTTFLLSCVNLQVNGVHEPNLVLALALGYGGLVQLLAGMWEMAVDNTFGATALSSYGGFWLSYAAVLTPSLGIVDSYTNERTGESSFHAVFALYLFGWFIFTSLCLLLTFRSSLAMCALFVVLDIAFLCLGLSEQVMVTNATASEGLQKAGGAFGILAAFLAWWLMFAGLAENAGFFTDVSLDFPWRRAAKRKAADERV